MTAYSAGHKENPARFNAIDVELPVCFLSRRIRQFFFLDVFNGLALTKTKNKIRVARLVRLSYSDLQ